MTEADRAREALLEAIMAAGAREDPAADPIERMAEFAGELLEELRRNGWNVVPWEA